MSSSASKSLPPPPNLGNLGAFLSAVNKTGGAPSDKLGLLRQIVETGRPADPVPMSDLLKSSKLGIQQVAAAIDQLESAGFVKLSHGDEDQVVAATELGQQLVGTL